MRRLPEKLVKQLLHALKSHSYRGIPLEVSVGEYRVVVRGVDFATGLPGRGSAPRIELWYRSFSHSRRFEITDSKWGTSQWEQVRAALASCIDLQEAFRPTPARESTARHKHPER